MVWGGLSENWLKGSSENTVERRAQDGCLFQCLDSEAWHTASALELWIVSGVSGARRPNYGLPKDAGTGCAIAACMCILIYSSVTRYILYILTVISWLICMASQHLLVTVLFMTSFLIIY